MSDMYDLVFQDAVKCYLENLKEEEKQKISDGDIKKIAYRLIYKNEYIWEVINEVIRDGIDEILNQK